jgi:thiamine-monophosphate kinase
MSQRGENALVAWLAERLRADGSRVPVGIGDDMAVIRLDRPVVAITSDMLLDGVHFDTAEHSYRQIGRKAIACSLSDCAGSGCTPRCATVSLALSDRMTLEDVQELYAGLAGMAEEFSCPIVGGDTTSWPGRLAIDVAMLGEAMTARGAVLRSGGRPGDLIYVSGPLGGSILGRHLTFTPRLKLALRLVSEPALTAMMDISDGLSMDLGRLCRASGCDAELDEHELARAVSEDAREMERRDGKPAMEHALSDGEDFELLVTGGPALGESCPELIPVGRLIPPGEGETFGRLWLVRADGRREPIEPRGYEHFT